MMLSEATNRLRKNVEEWYKVRGKLKDTKAAIEIDKDYEAIEILLAQTRLDFENWSYEELVEVGEYISTIKRKIKKKEYQKKYREEHLEEVREKSRKRTRKYRAEHLEEIREKDRERKRKKRKNEKVIALFG